MVSWKRNLNCCYVFCQAFQVSQGVGDTPYKFRPYCNVLQTWVAKSASWYITDPYKMQNMVYEWDNFHNSPKFVPKLIQILRKIGWFWAKSGLLYRLLFFLGNLSYEWVYFQNSQCSGASLRHKSFSGLQHPPSKNSGYRPFSIMFIYFRYTTCHYSLFKVVCTSNLLQQKNKKWWTLSWLPYPCDEKLTR